MQMARPSRWSQILVAARDEALNAVEFYNKPGARRPLESFLVHMHMAWLYLLHAEFERNKINYYYREKNSPRYIRVDGERKSWDLKKCVAYRWPDANDPVRGNLELTIQLRNKVEHRYEQALLIRSQGFCQSLVVNFEDEIVASFGSKHSIADQVSLPVSLMTLSDAGLLRPQEIRPSLPKHLDNFFVQFCSRLPDSVANDRRFELRLGVTLKVTPKSEADIALSFVPEADLSDEERARCQEEAKRGKVIVQEKPRSVANLGNLRPKRVCEEVEARIPFRFRLSSEFPRAWKKLGVRPATSAEGEARLKTDQRYAVYDEAHDDYVYTSAYVDLLVEHCMTAEGFEHLIGRRPVPK